MWYVYLLRCEDSSLYTGITKDLRRRMKQHSEGRGSAYVASRGFKRLELAVTATSRSEALKLEKAVKGVSQDKKHSQLRKDSDTAYQHLPRLTTVQDKRL